MIPLVPRPLQAVFPPPVMRLEFTAVCPHGLEVLWVQVRGEAPLNSDQIIELGPVCDCPEVG